MKAVCVTTLCGGWGRFKLEVLNSGTLMGGKREGAGGGEGEMYRTLVWGKKPTV